MSSKNDHRRFPSLFLPSFSAATERWRRAPVSEGTDENDETSQSSRFCAKYFSEFGRKGIQRRGAPRLYADRQWSSAQKRFTWPEGRPLGQGTYGKVFPAWPTAVDGRGGGPAVALKVCHIDQPIEHGLPETIIREVTLLRTLHGHPNIMPLDALSCDKDREIYLFCELLHLDLHKYILTQLAPPTASRTLPYYPDPLKERDIKHISRCVLTGLAYCHGLGIMHRDLKPHNILVTSDLSKIKIADFGLARIVHEPNKTLTYEVVTLWYRAPELLLGDCHYDESIDVWAAGCIIAELLRGQVLFRGDSEIDMLFRIFQLLGTPSEADWPQASFEDRQVFPRFKGDLACLGFGGPGADLVTRMLSLCPRKRPSCSECLEHPWLEDRKSKR